MPIYSKVFSDNCILDLINPKYRNVLLLGCGGCMNESLAFTHSNPLIYHGEQNVFPSIEAECNRITNLLRKHGYSAEKIILASGSNSRCITNLGERQFSLPNGIEPDIALMLSCPGGFWGISRVIKNIPLINITEQLGTIYYKYKDKAKLLRGKAEMV